MSKSVHNEISKDGSFQRRRIESEKGHITFTSFRIPLSHDPPRSVLISEGKPATEISQPCMEAGHAPPI